MLYIYISISKDKVFGLFKNNRSSKPLMTRCQNLWVCVCNVIYNTVTSWITMHNKFLWNLKCSISYYRDVLLSSMVSCSLREACQKVKEKSLPELDQQKKRAEFLPVEWRSSLKLDGGKQFTSTSCMFLAMECNCCKRQWIHFTF